MVDIEHKTDPLSLSPHKDAVAKVVGELRAHYEPLLSRPGYDGVHARVNLALMVAYSDAFATEMECGSTTPHTGEAVAEALGGIVASFGASLAIGEGKPENIAHAIQFMLQRVAHSAYASGNADYIGIEYTSSSGPAGKS